MLSLKRHYLFGGARQTDITTRQTHTHQKVVATRTTDRQTGCHASVSWPPVCCRSPQSKQECRCLIICVAPHIPHQQSQTAFFRKQEYLELGRILFSKISSVYLSVYLVLQSETLTLFLKWKLNLWRCQIFPSQLKSHQITTGPMIDDAIKGFTGFPPHSFPMLLPNWTTCAILIIIIVRKIIVMIMISLTIMKLLHPWTSW